MASAERIQLMRCPGCGAGVLPPPPDAVRSWECPFCRRRFRRRFRPCDSGTVPCFDLFSKNPWPPLEWPCEAERSLWHPARWVALTLTAYASVLLVGMVVYHVAMTALAALALAVRVPGLLWQALTEDDELPLDEPEPSPWLEPLRTWLPYFRCNDPDQSVGPMVVADDAPGIFVIVAEVSRKVGSREPDEIRVTHLPCCGVIEQRGWGGLGCRRRVLVVGLPLMYVLSIEELRAVIAHELAHLSRGDAAWAFTISQFIDSVEQSIAAGTTSRWARLHPCVLFARLARGVFGLLFSPLSRYQEYRADGVAAAVSGSDVISSALRKVALVQPVFKEVLCYYHPAVVEDVNLYQFFRIAWEAVGDGLKGEIEDSLAAEERSWLTDPHPTLRARLARLESLPPHREPDNRPARRLFTDRSKFEELLHNHIYRTRVRHLTVFQPAAESQTWNA